MKERKRLLLIGAVNLGNPPRNGEESKNQLLCEYLGRYHHLKVVDTREWKKNPITLWKVLYNTLFPDYDRILLSASSASVHTLLRFLGLFRKRKSRTSYLVIGGYLLNGLSTGRYKASSYDGLSSLVVEGHGMERGLLNLDLDTPVILMPNFKSIKRTWGKPDRLLHGPVRFIFLSRITESKGIPLIFESLRDIRLTSRRGEFVVDFFGPIESGYEDVFASLVEKEPNAGYRGYLDVTNERDKSYETISNYHVMLFPTKWYGEGFPGVILDAYACGLPVIASDWNMNREVVDDGHTGRVIPPGDSASLAEAMADVLDDREKWMRMAENCHAEAMRYDVDEVLDRHMPKILGM